MQMQNRQGAQAMPLGRGGRLAQHPVSDDLKASVTLEQVRDSALGQALLAEMRQELGASADQMFDRAIENTRCMWQRGDLEHYQAIIDDVRHNADKDRELGLSPMAGMASTMNRRDDRELDQMFTLKPDAPKPY